jgi:hypothetical protein
VGPRTGLDDVEKRKFLTLSGLELLPDCQTSALLDLDELFSSLMQAYTLAIV